MAKSILERNGISEEVVGLVSHLVDSIPYPERRIAMGEVTLTILGGSHRRAESVFGWNRSSVKLGIHEFESGIRCVDNVSERKRKKVEELERQLAERDQVIGEITIANRISRKLTGDSP